MRIAKTIRLEERLLRRLHAAASYLRKRLVYDEDRETTQSDIIQRALDVELTRLEDAYNEGRAFRSRKSSPRGRPAAVVRGDGRRSWPKDG